MNKIIGIIGFILMWSAASTIDYNTYMHLPDNPKNTWLLMAVGMFMILFSFIRSKRNVRHR